MSYEVVNETNTQNVRTDSILVAVVYVIDSTIRILDTMSHLTNTIKFMHLYLATLITFEPLERLGSFHLP